MMKQNLSDKGLKKAVQAQPAPPRLSTNFTFRTMQKVEELVRIRERKEERRMFLAIVAASIVLMIVGGIAIVYYGGEELVRAFTNLPKLDLLGSPYWMFSVIFFILMGFDYWMRKRYYKRHQEPERTRVY